MGYGIYLSCPTCREGEDIGSVSRNLGSMYFDVLQGGISSLNNKKAADAIPDLEAAIKKLEADPAKYRAMNPPNGFGSYDALVEVLKRLLENCKDRPNFIIHVLG
jgi:hypothetical protein